MIYLTSRSPFPMCFGTERRITDAKCLVVLDHSLEVVQTLFSKSCKITCKYVQIEFHQKVWINFLRVFFNLKIKQH